jgi:DNA helicase II / ATP-dependent DNA helicase PcrA
MSNPSNVNYQDYKLLNAADIREQMGIPYSDEQMEAILSGGKPGVVIAGAGSGKTAVMAARVVHLVMNLGVAPENILGLTFTNLATGELQQRVRKALSSVPESTQASYFSNQLRQKFLAQDLDFDNPSNRLEIELLLRDAEFGDCAVSTYHSFASSIVTEFGMLLGLDSSAEVLTGPSRAQLAAEVLRNPTTNVIELEGSFNSLLTQIIKLDDAMADFDLTVADFQKHLDEIKADVASRPGRVIKDATKMIDTAQKRVLLAELVGEFRARKLQVGVIDYADMTRFALQLARTDDRVRTEMRNRYQAVLLDEYQDTSVAQRKLMQELFKDGRSVTGVGDPLQCIYRFRGASPFNIDEFKNHFSVAGDISVHEFGMAVTQRNGKNIVALANKVAEPLREVHPAVGVLKAAQPARNGEGEIKAAQTESFSTEMDWLADELKQALADGLQPEEIAVILRRNKDVMEVHRQLTARGLACQVRSKWALLEVPEVAEVVSTLRILAEPAANSDWIRILTGPRWRIGDRDLKLIADVASEIARGLNPVFDSENNLENALDKATAETDSVSLAAYGDAIAQIADIGSTTISQAAVERIRNLQREVSYLRQFTADGIDELVSRIIRTTGLAIEAAASDERVARGMVSNLRAFSNLIKNFNTLGTAGTLFDFLDWMDAGRKYDAEPDLPLIVHKGAIQLMTIHASKGLEYPLVALPRLFEGAFPSTKKSSSWLTSKIEIPYSLKDERIDPKVKDFPIGAESLAGADFKHIPESVKEFAILDERRMAYVAITRAKSKLLLSTSWVQPGEDKPREPSIFFEEMIEALNSQFADFKLSVSAPQPDEDAFTPDPVIGQWPKPISDPQIAAIHQLANLIINQGETPVSGARGLTESESALVADWDAAILGLQNEAEERLVEKVAVLPKQLSVSALQLLAKNESEFLLQLVRPMPNQPSRAATKGTEFHAELERRFYAMHFKGLQNELELEDALEFESQSTSDNENLEKLLRNFENSEWGPQVPVAFEKAFTMKLGGRAVFGRIDAVYPAPENDVDYDWLVIDWKTNLKATADPLQLAIYRLAWAAEKGCDVSRVRAGFFYAETGETQWPKLPDFADIQTSLFGN